MITCTKCGITKEDSYFYNRSDTKTKKTEQCKDCISLRNKQWKLEHPHYQRDYCNKRRHNNKIDIITKLGGKCSKCGLIDDHVIYDLHHINPAEKEYSLGQILDHSSKKITNEINKCILLCANCHRKEHEFLRQQDKIGYGKNQKDLIEIKESDVM